MADLQIEGTLPFPHELNTPVRFNATKFRGAVEPSRATTANGNPVFTGSYTGVGLARFRVAIDAAATPDTFTWDLLTEFGQLLQSAATVAVTGAAQVLGHGISVTFPTTTGYAVGDSWQIAVASDALQARSDVEGALALELRGSSVQDASASSVSHDLRSYGTAAQRGAVVFRKANGTRTAPTIIANGDDLGSIDFRGFDGSAADGTEDSSWPVAARILCEIGAAPGAGDMPGQLLFQVTPDGSVTPATALTIAPSGTITIGALAVASLAVGGGYGATGSTLDASGNLQMNGNLTVDGDLTVSGATVTTDVATLTVEDPLIELARSNAADVVDVGFYANYNDGTLRFAGLFRDASDGVFKLFDALDAEPTTTVATADPQYDHADLQVGGLTVDDATALGGNVGFTAGDKAISQAASAAETVGGALSVTPASGGASAGVAAGGVGGAFTQRAGVGGAGDVAQLAGVGGAHIVAGGAAGADGGGGGAAGGDLSLRGGNASGAGVDGVVRIGDADTSAVIITPAVTLTDPTSLAGVGITRNAAALDLDISDLTGAAVAVSADSFAFHDDTDGLPKVATLASLMAASNMSVADAEASIVASDVEGAIRELALPPTLTPAAEAGNAIAVAFAAGSAQVAQYIARAYLPTGLQGAGATCTETGAGAEVFGTGTPTLLFTTDAAGAATITVSDVAAESVLLVIEPASASAGTKASPAAAVVLVFA